jgi:hypothetical protein
MFRVAMLVVFLSVLAVAVIGIVSMTGLPGERYYNALAIASGAAAIASWLLTPAALDRERPAWAAVRWGARIGLAIWPFGLWSAADPAVSRWETLALQSIGLIGGMLFLAALASIAREVELLYTSRRLTTLAFLTIPIGAFTWIMPFPESRLLIPDGPVGMIGVIFLLIAILPWYWLLLQVIRSAWELLSESRWSVRARRDRAKRDAAFQARVSSDDSSD